MKALRDKYDWPQAFEDISHLNSYYGMVWICEIAAKIFRFTVVPGVRGRVDPPSFKGFRSIRSIILLLDPTWFYSAQLTFSRSLCMQTGDLQI